MSEWIRLCSKSDLPAEGHAKEFQIQGHTLCVATLGGQPLALDNICPHRGGPLAEGFVEHGKIVCPWHAWEFDLITGQATHAPAAKVATYTLRTDGDDILVALPAASLPEPAP